jgi:hypothetical protein
LHSSAGLVLLVAAGDSGSNGTCMTCAGGAKVLKNQ